MAVKNKSPSCVVRHTSGENIRELGFASQVGTRDQVLPAFAAATAGTAPAEWRASGASVFEAVVAGFMSFQASRYFSNDDLLDPGVTHITFRRSMRVAGKMYQASSGIM